MSSISPKSNPHILITNENIRRNALWFLYLCLIEPQHYLERGSIVQSILKMTLLGTGRQFQSVRICDVVFCFGFHLNIPAFYRVGEVVGSSVEAFLLISLFFLLQLLSLEEGFIFHPLFYLAGAGGSRLQRGRQESPFETHWSMAASQGGGHLSQDLKDKKWNHMESWTMSIINHKILNLGQDSSSQGSICNCVGVYFTVETTEWAATRKGSTSAGN